MIQHQVGYDVSKECELETLLNYLQNAFKVDNDMHERVLHETKNMEVRISSPIPIPRVNISTNYKIVSHLFIIYIATGNAFERRSDRSQRTCVERF